ncbi:hypothetical protein G3N28_12475 [Desulfobacter hydrogenophilus]|uniref:hypothetical protein n=1 Tax=Desulfobacter hydrogenophilus TaxID=2291 RepID=UPI0013CF7181|nr:hypothetical protein [Desulfobacter hydrogenophilus]NDY72852.1 hypothetical protein [Desulfobacter hydrogenophilus]
MLINETNAIEMPWNKKNEKGDKNRRKYSGKIFYSVVDWEKEWCAFDCYNNIVANG